MDKAKTPIHLKAILIILILGLAAFVLYFYFFINPAQVVSILSKINVTIYAGAFISYFLFTLCSALVWRQLLKNLSIKLSLRKSLLFTWVGLFFEAVVPQLGWSGEISKTYLLAKESNQDASKIGATVVAQKLFTITLTIVALSTGLGSLLLSYHLPFIDSFFIVLILALSILSLIIIYYVSVKPAATKTLLNVGIRIILFFRKIYDSQKLRERAEKFLGGYHSSIKQLGENPKRFFKAIIYAIVSFIFEISVIFLSFYALGQSVPISTVLIVFTLTGTLQTVGITLLGFTEIVMTSIFSFLGVSVVLSFSVTLLSRIVTLWFRLIVSYIALQWTGIRIITKKPSA